jgi:hypothetical protein
METDDLSMSEKWCSGLISWGFCICKDIVDRHDPYARCCDFKYMKRIGMSNSNEIFFLMSTFWVHRTNPLKHANQVFLIRNQRLRCYRKYPLVSTLLFKSSWNSFLTLVRPWNSITSAFQLIGRGRAKVQRPLILNWQRPKWRSPGVFRQSFITCGDFDIGRDILGENGSWRDPSPNGWWDRWIMRCSMCLWRQNESVRLNEPMWQLSFELSIWIDWCSYHFFGVWSFFGTDSADHQLK